MENEEVEFAPAAVTESTGLIAMDVGPEPGTVKDMSHGIAGDEEPLPDGDAEDEEGTEL